MKNSYFVCLLALAVPVLLFGDQTTPQTIDVESFVPGSPTVKVLSFDKFDTQGGTRTLTGVTISLTQKTWGGYYAVDNDSGTPAYITVQHGTSGSLSASGYTIPPELLSSIYAQVTSGGQITLPADDGLDTIGTFQWDGGDDNFQLQGPAQGAPVTATATGTLTGSALTAYVGTGTLDVNYNSSQASSSTAAGGVAYGGNPANAMATLTVTYTFDVVPEPTSLALLAFGCITLGLRRRPRGQK